MQGLLVFLRVLYARFLLLFLVEFGFPTDTIRALENKYPSIGKMGALEAATFLSNNQRAMYSVMDAYEQELFKRAMQVLVKRG